jgi:hypothetical protein
MVKGLSVLFILALAGCSGLRPFQHTASSCLTGGESSYECQVERYHNVNVQ